MSVFIISLLYATVFIAVNAQIKPTSGQLPATSGDADKYKVKPLPTPPSNEIRCRGNKEGKLIFETLNPQPSEVVTMALTHLGGAVAAGTLGVGLRPGNCAWVDRPLSGNQPLKIRFKIAYYGQLKQTLHGTAIDRSPTAAERFPDSLNIADYLKDENHYWRFFIKDSGQDYLEATYNQYWRPPTVLKSQPNQQSPSSNGKPKM